jgi:hypothetical protein
MGIGTPNSQSKIERPMSEPFVGEDEKELKPMGKVPKHVSGGLAAPDSFPLRCHATDRPR